MAHAGRLGSCFFSFSTSFFFGLFVILSMETDRKEICSPHFVSACDNTKNGGEQQLLTCTFTFRFDQTLHSCFPKKKKKTRENEPVVGCEKPYYYYLSFFFSAFRNVWQVSEPRAGGPENKTIQSQRETNTQGEREEFYDYRSSQRLNACHYFTLFLWVYFSLHISLELFFLFPGSLHMCVFVSARAFVCSLCCVEFFCLSCAFNIYIFSGLFL